MEIQLTNGEKIKINDHVYCASNWAIRDGTPYSVARVMEFLPVEGASHTRTKGKGRDVFTRARIAWYYRPGDISDRQVSDSRLLLAAIYTEVIPLTHIRGRCWVRHKEKIPDLLSWRKKPDRFYYHRLFDPFIKKEFDILPTADIHNLPRHIKDVLVSRYEYVVAEKEVIPDLIDQIRLCEPCGEWCPTPESVQCASCRNHFHMSCVQPPMASKPSRGYGWTCAVCAKRREEEMDATEVNNGNTPSRTKASATISKIRSKQRKERHSAITNVEEDNDRYFKMWSFRYFGTFTNAEDTLDPEDSIFVRAPPRIGIRYQSQIPAMVDRNGMGTDVSGANDLLYPAIDRTEELSVDLPERGGDATIEVLSSLQGLDEEQLEDIEDHMRSIAKRDEQFASVDWRTEAVLRISEAIRVGDSFENVDMKDAQRMWKFSNQFRRYADREWSDNELAAFEDALSLHGPEMRAVKDELHTRSMAEIVRHFGHFKAKCLEAENKVVKARLKDSNGVIKKMPQSLQPLVTNDDEDSITKAEPGKRSTSCAACGSTTATTWWKAPKGLATSILCDFCGISWRKYGDLTLRSAREDSLPHKSRAAVTDKREGTPLAGPNAKKPKVQDRIPVRQLPCQCCKKLGPIGRVLKCANCTLSCHAVTSGAQLQEGESPDSWLCDLCQNEKTMEHSLDNRCVLCPRTSKAIENVKDPTYLRSCKPTEGQGWVHTLCSLFFPDIQFSDAEAMKTVEGISTIPIAKAEGGGARGGFGASTCFRCQEATGATVKCADCPKEYHVSCAHKVGCKFGFEIMPVKNSRKEVMATTAFKRETGIMNIHFWCPDHPLTYRKIYDLCEFSSETGQSAIQVFNRTYKQVNTDSTHALLRKAQRLDHVINAHRRETAAPPLPQPEPEPTEIVSCRQCRTEVSPLFHKISDTEYECHRCRFSALGAIGQTIKLEVL